MTVFDVRGMQFVKGRPTYKLLPGAVRESFALSVTERLNIDQEVISCANELLDSETRQMGDLIHNTEDQNAVIDNQPVEVTNKYKELKDWRGR
jgi:DNA mismatch repair protein MutS2